MSKQTKTELLMRKHVYHDIFILQITTTKDSIHYKYTIYIFHLSPKVINPFVHRTFKPLTVLFNLSPNLSSFTTYHIQRNSYFFPELLIDKFLSIKYKLPFH